MTRQEPLVSGQSLTLAPLGGLSITTIGLLGAVCVAEVFKAAAAWNHYSIVRDDIAGVPNVGVSDLIAAENADHSAFLVGWLTFVAGAVMLLVWLWYARRNSELINSAKHRLARGWVVGAWFCPVVQLWYPRMIVDDIWRASRPDGAPSRLVRYWWYTLLAVAVIISWLVLVPRPDAITQRLRELAVTHTVIAGLLCVAAVLLSLVIRQVTRWQSVRRA